VRIHPSKSLGNLETYSGAYSYEACLNKPLFIKGDILPLDELYTTMSIKLSPFNSISANTPELIPPAQAFFNKVPDFTPTPNLSGILEIGFAYNANVQGYPVIGGCSNKNDTATFKFWLRDKGKNISDTLVSPPIILQR
jgi:hypothetical protein